MSEEDNKPIAEQVNPEEEKPRTIHGGRNLMIMGFGAILIALTTTSISLFIYRSTGDIYLDRSRPGFISEGEKHGDEDEGNEDFSNEGEVGKETLDEYLKEIDSINGRLNAHEDNFSEEQLSDDALGIYQTTEGLF